MLQKEGHSKMDVLQMVPLWIFNFFPDNVWKYDFSNLAGWKRCGKLKRSGKTVLDDQSSMELGIFSNEYPCMGCAV